MNKGESSDRSRPRWRNAGWLALGGAVALAGAFGVAHAAGFGPMAFVHGHDPAMAHDFIEFRVGKLLKQVNATDAQQQQVMAIVDAAFAKHQGMAAMHARLHQRLLAILAAPTVDRAAIEAVRVDAMNRIDAASKDLASALGDIAEVLTPAQRAQLAQLAQQHFQ
jgi:periplasmic protein CpxP/Spy